MKKTIITIILLALTALSVSAQNIIGAWEMRTDRGLEVIYFSTGGIFFSYLNGEFFTDGSYSLSERIPNQPQTLIFEFGIFDRMDSGFYIKISANELVFTNWDNTKIEGGRRYKDGIISSSIATPGTYRRSSFVLSDAKNPLIGTWKSTSEIYRFYHDGDGTLFSYQNEPTFTEKWRYRISYEFSNVSGTGKISIKAFDDNFSAEDWYYGVVAVYPFVINGNVLRVEYEGGIAVFTRQ